MRTGRMPSIGQYINSYSYINVINSDNSTVLHLENVYSGPTPPIDLQNGARIFLSGTNSPPHELSKSRRMGIVSLR